MTVSEEVRCQHVDPRWRYSEQHVCGADAALSRYVELREAAVEARVRAEAETDKERVQYYWRTRNARLLARTQHDRAERDRLQAEVERLRAALKPIIESVLELPVALYPDIALNPSPTADDSLT